jgi:hypothetical protein
MYIDPMQGLLDDEAEFVYPDGQEGEVEAS